MVSGFDLNDSSKPKTVILFIDYTNEDGGVINIDDFISNYNANRDFEFI
jgi:hypothetical protein